jgi:D-beta-D-heptose 7-phosphate kinase/D-beta-D-heptose 1-phosphate adenosyltransferase
MLGGAQKMKDKSISYNKYISSDLAKSIMNFCKTGCHTAKVAVVGDYMLDRYIYGDVGRISPEAPVPVVRLSEEKAVPGGAGNVVANLIGLGLSVTAVGRIGNDLYGDILLGIPLMKQADVSNILRTGSTIVKTRILGGGRQQMLRLDREEICPPGMAESENMLQSLLISIQNGVSNVIISDYGKGICTPFLCSRIIHMCKEHGVPVFVDPKGRDWLRYSGAFLVTPNVEELRLASGSEIKNDDADIVRCGTDMLNKFGIENLLVTRSDKGATLINSSGFRHERANAVEVYDVSGAGDTMIAAVAAFYAGGMALSDCVSAANLASQIVVGKIGTYPIKSEDLIYEIMEAGPLRCGKSGSNTGCEPEAKIMDWKTTEKICDELKKEGKKIIFTNGCFDILHAGHADLLNKARALGDCLIVGLNSDESVRRLKGTGRPVNRCADRARVLASMQAVDIVVVFGEDTPSELLSHIRPSLIVKGGDYRKEDIAGREYAGDTVIVPLLKGYSTTGIIASLGGFRNGIRKSGRVKWLILDRDGTLIQEKDYLHDPEEVVIFPEVIEGLCKLKGSGYKFVVVTNQSGIGRGYYTENDLKSVNLKISSLLSEHGIEIAGYYHCPHVPGSGCGCRKPEAGLINQAAFELGFEVDDIAYVIGDKKSDIELAENIGTSSILVKTGYGIKEYADGASPVFVARDFNEAADIILKNGEVKNENQ